MRATVEYDGTGYAGFQTQATLPSIQAALERAVSATTGEETRVVGAGRTDAGAHAWGQVVAFTTVTRLDDATLLRALNAHLPADIAVTDVDTVPPDFHPRFDATGREYMYLVLNRAVRSPLWVGRAFHCPYALDERAMAAAALCLRGRRDFSAFAGVERSREPDRPPRSRVREIFDARVERAGDLVRFTFRGNAFMKHMIRSIVGTLLLVGRGRLSVEGFAQIVKSCDHNQAGAPAPAYGLYLLHVTYGSERL